MSAQNQLRRADINTMQMVHRFRKEFSLLPDSTHLCSLLWHVFENTTSRALEGINRSKMVAHFELLFIMLGGILLIKFVYLSKICIQVSWNFHFVEISMVF